LKQEAAALAELVRVRVENPFKERAAVRNKYQRKTAVQSQVEVVGGPELVRVPLPKPRCGEIASSGGE